MAYNDMKFWLKFNLKNSKEVRKKKSFMSIR